VNEQAKKKLSKRHAIGNAKGSGVRIIGAEQVADIVAGQRSTGGDMPDDSRDEGLELSTEGTAEQAREDSLRHGEPDGPDAPALEDSLLTESAQPELDIAEESPDDGFELPHWSDPPTGQVPAVLYHSSESGGEGVSSSTSPAWREYDSDWDTTGDLREVFGDDSESKLGSLDPNKEDVTEIYSFTEIDDLLSEPSPSSPSSPPSTSDISFSSSSRLSEYELEQIEEELRRAREDRRTSGLESPLLLDDDTDGGASTGKRRIEEQRRLLDDDTDGGTSTGATVPLEQAYDAGSEGGVGPYRSSTVERRDEGDENGIIDLSQSSSVETDDIEGFDARSSDRRHLETPDRRYVRRKGRSTRRTRSSRNVLLSVTTGLIFGAVAVAAFELGSAATLALCAVILFVAGGEALRALRRAGQKPASSVVLAGIIAVLVGAYKGGVSAIAPITALVIGATLIYYVLDKLRSTSLAQLSLSIMVFAWIGILGSFAGALLDPSVYPHRNGVAFLVGAIIVTVAYDVGGLLVGATLGRHKLAPRLSPGKTVEGLIGATVLSIAIAVVIVGRIHPWDLYSAALLGCVVAVVAPLGDLSESLIKRDLHLKDMGSLLPGHGGFIDRIDGLLFAIPATYELIRLLHLI